MCQKREIKKNSKTMNLYKYLLGSEDRRQKFCVELIKRFPEIYGIKKNLFI